MTGILMGWAMHINKQKDYIKLNKVYSLYIYFQQIYENRNIDAF